MIGQGHEVPSEDWAASLQARFSIAKTAGFSCFEGWKPILVCLLENLSLIIKNLPPGGRHAFSIIEIRQKFGTLTVYLSERPTHAMQEAIDQAREASMVTCEVCGAVGTLAERRAWISVRCEAHENWSRFDPRPVVHSP